MRVQLVVSGPASSTLKDYVDLLWFADAQGTVLVAQKFKSNGKTATSAASTDTEAVEPALQGCQFEAYKVAHLTAARCHTPAMLLR